MAMSVRNLIKERKYPFICGLSLALFLISATVFLLFHNASPSPLSLFSDLQQRPFRSSETPTIDDGGRRDAIYANGSDGDRRSNGTDRSDVSDVDLELEWRLCKGSVSVDYIPCLDNMKAIKELKSRRHMEHRERHCPKPSPRCLVPLPEGYKVPVPWPKSRDMVRLLNTLW